MDDVEKQHRKNFDWLKAYSWQKGQSGNPAGRPPTKSLKAFAREFLSNLSEEDRVAFFQSMDPKEVWKMAEGNPHQDVDHTTQGKELPTTLLVRFVDAKDTGHTD